MEKGSSMLPAFLYGTAWKEGATAELTRLALATGFRGIDTANQRKHYFEAAVGEGIAASGIARDELFLQTKFTYRDSQDHRMPYDPNADVQTQVRQSFASSLEHLRTDYLDSYVLHGPSRRRGISREDLDVWQTMESLHAERKTRVLGISNVTLAQLDELLSKVSVRPSFVQNRCYAVTGWDAEIRAFCRRHDIIYQGFSLLTANVAELRSAAFRDILRRVGRTPAQIVFRFAMQAGMLPLTGTTDVQHMREDLAATEFELSAADVERIEHLSYGAKKP